MKPKNHIRQVAPMILVIDLIPFLHSSPLSQMNISLIEDLQYSPRHRLHYNVALSASHHLLSKIRTQGTYPDSPHSADTGLTIPQQSQNQEGVQERPYQLTQTYPRRRLLLDLAMSFHGVLGNQIADHR